MAHFSLKYDKDKSMNQTTDKLTSLTNLYPRPGYNIKEVNCNVLYSANPWDTGYFSLINYFY